MIVAIQGQTGSFHDQARAKLFSHSEALHCGNFSEVFEAVKSARAEYGIVAIENSLYGSINDVYSLLLNKGFWISGELYLQISLSLLGQKNAKLSDIEEVYSHPVAIAESSHFLDEKLPKASRIDLSDTAAAAERIASNPDKKQAAIADPKLSETFNLKVIAENIQNYENNYTRFIVIQKDKQQPSSANKHSIILELEEKPGTLHKALGFFAERKINLTKLESHPIPGKTWKYMFYLDFESSLDQSLRVTKELEDYGSKVTILGSYNKADPFGG